MIDDSSISSYLSSGHFCILFSDEPIEVTAYMDALKISPIWKELSQVRNIRPSFHATRAGMAGVILYTGTMWYALRGKEPWTFSHGRKFTVIYLGTCFAASEDDIFTH